MKGQEALPEHLTDDVLRHRNTISRSGRVHVAKSRQPGIMWYGLQLCLLESDKERKLER
jgi:hypothetical protein